jgi:hypothetical protein
MIKDLEKGIGHLLGHEEPETMARRKAHYRELIRQKVEGPRSVLNAPVPNVTVLPNVIDITKYNGPPTTAHGQKKLEQRKEIIKERKDELKKQNESNRYLKKPGQNKLDLEYPFNKVSGRFEDRSGNKVDPRLAKKEQDELDTKIEGAKTLQKISDYDRDNEPNARKAYWIYDIRQKDFIDINKKKTKPMKMNDYIDRINYLYVNNYSEKKPIHQQLTDLSNWDKENRRQGLANEESRKQNKETTNNKEGYVRQV